MVAAPGRVWNPHWCQTSNHCPYEFRVLLAVNTYRAARRFWIFSFSTVHARNFCRWIYWFCCAQLCAVKVINRPKQNLFAFIFHNFHARQCYTCLNRNFTSAQINMCVCVHRVRLGRGPVLNFVASLICSAQCRLINPLVLNDCFSSRYIFPVE